MLLDFLMLDVDGDAVDAVDVVAGECDGMSLILLANCGKTHSTTFGKSMTGEARLNEERSSNKALPHQKMSVEVVCAFAFICFVLRSPSDAK